MLEPLRLPVSNLQVRDDVFSVPHADLFYLDLLGGTGVIGVDELRERYWTVLHDANPGLVWMVTDVRSLACRGLLHVERPPTESALRVVALFVVGEELVMPADVDNRLLPVHEVLLLTLAAYADDRRLDIRVRGDVPLCQSDPLICLLLGFLTRRGVACPPPQPAPGFMRHGPRQLVRPPMAETSGTNDLLAAMYSQVNGLLYRQWLRCPVEDRTPDSSTRTAAARTPPAPSKSAATPTDSPSPPGTDRAVDSPSK